MKTLFEAARPMLAAITAAAALAAASTGAHAQAEQFPNRPVKLIVTSAVGGSGDLVARLVAEKLSGLWGQPVVVEQKVGANGMVGTMAAQKAPPDGYTAFMSYTSLVQNLFMLPDPGYTMDDFVPVSMVTALPLVLAASNTLGADSVADLIQRAREQNGTLSYGSSGIGSSGHLMGASLARLGGVKMIHVPYKGEAASFTDLASGRLSAHFGSIGFYGPQAAAGKVRILAVASRQRLRRHPSIPTLAEAGYGGANLAGWAAIFVPAGTPPAIVQKMSDGVQKVLAQPDVQNAILDVGFEPGGSSPEQLARFLRQEVDRWGTVIKDPALRIER